MAVGKNKRVSKRGKGGRKKAYVVLLGMETKRNSESAISMRRRRRRQRRPAAGKRASLARLLAKAPCEASRQVLDRGA